MKRIFIIAGLLIILLLPVASLSCGEGNIKAALGEEFTLPVGKTADIAGEDLSIQFVEVTEDSRCPTGVECVWMGVARCRMLMKQAETSKEITLAQAGGTDAYEDYSKYKISFKLEPYPEGAKIKAQSDYKLVMTVTKK
ncbi:MAG: hypothetical protein ABR954_01900 [Dehalococcoidales bacterium]